MYKIGRLETPPAWHDAEFVPVRSCKRQCILPAGRPGAEGPGAPIVYSSSRSFSVSDLAACWTEDRFAGVLKGQGVAFGHRRFFRATSFRFQVEGCNIACSAAKRFSLQIAASVPRCPKSCRRCRPPRSSWCRAEAASF